MRERDIFIEALQRASHAEREAYLVSECAGDEALRRDVDELLAEHHNQDSFFLDAPPPGVNATLEHPLAEKPGMQIGPYRLLQQIGEGGFGVVFMAEQMTPVRRKVALKIIKPGMDTRQVIARFEAERQALAMMDHVNIARVLDGGATANDRPYFVMELVNGVPITEYCDDDRLTPRQRLELFVPVCQAIQHAHQKGIIHRDIKPSNVMVTLYDGQPVPKVIDFGVAKATQQPLTERTLFTHYGTLVGTLEYMSPEQAEMSALGADTRSDVYSLGVLLYELLTGGTPLSRNRIREAPYADVLRMITSEEPPRPSTRLCDSGETLALIAARRRIEPAKLTRLVRGELDWIVMKCLEKDRNRRYETAGSLAADVRRYLNGEAVQACPPSARYRFRKFARRHKAALATASVVAVAVLLVLAALATSTFLIAREQLATAKALEAERGAKNDLKQDSYFHRIALAQRELSLNNLGGARQLLDDCPDDLRQWEWRYLMRLCRFEPVILQDDAEIYSVAFSPDGERLASAGGDGKVKIWSTQTGEVIQQFEAHPRFVSSVAFHPTGKLVASVGADSRVKVWDLSMRQPPLFDAPCDAVQPIGTAYATAFSPDGRRLAAGSNGAVKVWDWRNDNDQPLHTFAGHPKKGISVAYSHDGRHLASGGWHGGVQLWDAEAGGEPLGAFPQARKTFHPISALAFSPDDRRLATATFDRRLDVWDTTTGALLNTIPHNGFVLGVAFSKDGRRLISAGEDKTVRIWDATSGREVLGLRGHTKQCRCVAFSPDGSRLASASLDGTIRVWDATPLQGHESQESLDFTGHTNEVWTVAVSPGGEKIVSAGWSMPVHVWDPQTEVGASFSGHGNIVFCAAWHPDGQRVATAGGNGDLFTVKVWNARTGRIAFVLPPGPREYYAAAFSPDGRYLVTGSANRTVQVWDAATGAPKGALGAHEREIRGVVFSRDGRRLASASGDGEVKLWDATRLETDQTETARSLTRGWFPGPFLNVAFSPAGDRLATTGEKHTVKILDVETGRELHTLWGHSGDVYTVSFSHDPDGRWIASAGEDSTVKIWDSHAGGAPVRSFRGHTGLVSSVAFTPDGRVVSGSRDHTVKIWDLTQLDQLPEDHSGNGSDP